MILILIVVITHHRLTATTTTTAAVIAVSVIIVMVVVHIHHVSCHPHVQQVRVTASRCLKEEREKEKIVEWIKSREEWRE
jgi:hypothetical protein